MQLSTIGYGGADAREGGLDRINCEYHPLRILSDSLARIPPNFSLSSHYPNLIGASRATAQGLSVFNVMNYIFWDYTFNASINSQLIAFYLQPCLELQLSLADERFATAFIATAWALPI